MTTKNLWGELPNIEDKKGPQLLLKEQGELLSTQTGGRLRGVVKSYTSEDSIVTDLEVIAPFINNYRVVIVKAWNGPLIYPVEVEDVMAEKYEKYTCKTYEEFESAVSKILSSPRVRDVIASLLIQSK